MDRSIPRRIGRTTDGRPASVGTAPLVIVGAMLEIRTVAALDTDLAVKLDGTARPKRGQYKSNQDEQKVVGKDDTEDTRHATPCKIGLRRGE